jgi:prepilin-type N-terminal cleavage/methylation domain-containing protein
MKSLRRQGGFTFIEMMLAVFILSILAVLVSRMYSRGINAWMWTYNTFRLQQSARAIRDDMTHNLRLAEIPTVLLTRVSSTQSPFSMVTFVDANGNTQAYYQSGNDLLASFWRVNSVAHTQTLLKGNLQRFYVYYPDAKDMTRIGFSLYLTKQPYTGSKNIEVMQNTVVEMRNR